MEAVSQIETQRTDRAEVANPDAGRPLQVTEVDRFGLVPDLTHVGEEHRLEITAEGDTVTLSVTDNGPGVDETMQGDLFTPFASAKPIYKGLGLGLSLARSIIEDAGGSLDYAPRQDPFQSRFVVKLPAHD